MRPPSRVKQLLLEARGTITTEHTIISGWKHRWWVFRRVALETIWAFLHHLQESPGLQAPVAEICWDPLFLVKSQQM